MCRSNLCRRENGAMDGFLKGAFCAAITTSAELGYLGKTLHSASQSANIFTPTLSAVVVLFMQALNDSVHLAKGDITKQEFAFNLEKNTYVIVGALAMGLALQAIVNIPVVSYMLGSMVGSVLGGLVFEAKEHFFMSLCVEKDIHSLAWLNRIMNCHWMYVRNLDMIHLSMIRFNTNLSI